MKILNLVLALSLISSSAFGVECSKAVSLLNEGAAAPCTGYLFDIPTTKEATNNKLELPLVKSQLEILQHQVDAMKKQLKDTEDIADLQNQKSELWRKSATEATEKLISAENGRGTRDALFYAGGIVTMLLLIFAESQAQQRR